MRQQLPPSAHDFQDNAFGFRFSKKRESQDGQPGLAAGLYKLVCSTTCVSSLTP